METRSGRTTQIEPVGYEWEALKRADIDDRGQGRLESLFAGGVLGDGLGALTDGVLGKLTG